jgi:hypothetical protein
VNCNRISSVNGAAAGLQNRLSLSQSFSSSSSSDPKPKVTFVVIGKPERKLPSAASLLGFEERKDFPLPGNTSTLEYLVSRRNKESQAAENKATEWNEQCYKLLKEPLDEEKQLAAVMSFGVALEARKKAAPAQSSVDLSSIYDAENVECAAHEVPLLVRKNFKELFPGREICGPGPLTAITVSRRTEQDMSAWSEEMEAEREELTVEFISTASKICESLRQAGFWADFIDPSSGRPYFGPFTNNTLFETDDRYQYFGFQIEDLGCCKVIWHGEWRSKVFTGIIFTAAPADLPLLAPFHSNRVGVSSVGPTSIPSARLGTRDRLAAGEADASADDVVVPKEGVA